MSVVGDWSPGGYSKDTNWQGKGNLQQNQNLQCRQIQGKFALIDLARVELSDHGKLLYVVD